VSLLQRHPLAVVLLSVLTATACGQIPASTASGTSANASPSTVVASATSTPTAGAGGPGACEYTPSGTPAKPVDAPPTTAVPTSGTVTYALTMSSGVVKITMDRSKAPCTVNSFISLADQGFYDKTSCHRLADSGIFILQCGDPTGTGSGGPGYQYADETDGTEKYKAGVVAMANAGPDTNGSQFFLVWDDSALPPDYTILGTMDKAGREVVAGIASQGQDGTGGDGTGKPNAPAEIITAKKV
jgi:peptidyl-prolyl cis-trans isomerase B (cyclophilin B)